MIYNSHFYGSNLWNLFAIDDVYIAWNNVVRMVFDLPRSTHRCLLEPVSEFKHLFTLLTNRFLKFYRTLFLSDKIIISNLRRIQENDCRSNFGSNIRNICILNNSGWPQTFGGHFPGFSRLKSAIFQVFFRPQLAVFQVFQVFNVNFLVKIAIFQVFQVSK